MISGLSAATNGLHLALASFDKAASAMVSSASQLGEADAPTGSGTSSTDGLDSATVSMVTARLAFRASLVAAHTANEMVGDLMSLAYTPKPSN